MGVVNNLMTARMHQFEHIIATELPVIVEELQLNAAAREALDEYVVGLQDWMAGILDWHRASGRYPEPALRRRYRKRPQQRGGPTGLGTSATLISGLRGHDEVVASPTTSEGAPVPVLAGVFAPAAHREVANVVAALLSGGQRPASMDRLQLAADQPPGNDSQPAASSLDRLVTGPTGRGTSAARILRPSRAVATSTPTSDEPSEREIDSAEQGGIYPGPLDRLHKASIGRLMMLAQSVAGRHRGVARR